MREREVQQTANVALAYLAACVVTVLAMLVPTPVGRPGLELALPVLGVIALGACWTRFGVAFLILSFSLTRIRVNVGPLEFPLSDLAALGLLAGEGLKALTTRPRMPIVLPLRMYFVFLLGAAVSAVLAETRGHAMYYVVRSYSFYAVAYLFGVVPAFTESLRSTLRAFLIVLVPMIVASIVFSLIRIVEYDDLWAEKMWDAWPFGHVQEVLPTTLVLFWPFIRLIRKESIRTSDRHGIMVVELLLLVCLVLGFVKTAWLEFVAVAATIVTIEASWHLSYARLVARVRLLMIGAPLVLASAAALLTVLNPGSIVHRAVQWVASIEYWRRHPILGNGPGTAAEFQFESVTGFLLRKGEAMQATEPHGFAIKLLPEVGAVGFILYCLFWVATFVLVVRSFRGADAQTRHRSTAAFATLVGLVTYLFASPDVFSPRSWTIFALAIALVLQMPARATSSTAR